LFGLISNVRLVSIFPLCRSSTKIIWTKVIFRGSLLVGPRRPFLQP
jgi:hypothetical protein